MGAKPEIRLADICRMDIYGAEGIGWMGAKLNTMFTVKKNSLFDPLQLMLVYKSLQEILVHLQRSQRYASVYTPIILSTINSSISVGELRWQNAVNF